MNILFLTLNRVSDLSERGIYTDLMREFICHGHRVYMVVPAERRFHESTSIKESCGAQILRVKTLNIQKSNVVEKGIGTLLLEMQYQCAIKRYWKDIRFDLILYSTPPITFNRVISSQKKRCKAKSYLLLKDIFPQNAVDLGMFSKRSLIYRLFRKKEKVLYQISDFIGCMSPANVDYVLTHNPEIKADRVEICPNSIKLLEKPLMASTARKNILQKLHIPINKTLFIYGGNLGRPQGLIFLLDVIAANEERNDSYFIIVGSGTEYGKIKSWFEANHPDNSMLLSSLPKKEYDDLVKACDVGLIFLDKRFTIPNYPSRLLSYLENRMPVLLATDLNTDIGRIAERNGSGFGIENGNLDTFMEMVDSLSADREKIKVMGEKGYEYLKSNYTVERGYRMIMKHFE